MSLPTALLALADEPLVLAVSGGRDSMALLHAAAQAIPERVAAVATFDHGTGADATRAMAHVTDVARSLGMSVARGRAERGTPPTEAAWRRARWEFLRWTAAQHGAAVVTAHTCDDLLETVVMRLLRGTGARGLAPMLVPSSDAPVRIVRPFLHLPRAAVAAWATAHAVRWIDDPTNASRRWLRNRVRLDLLPAMERVRPGIGAELLDLAERAAVVRATLDRCAIGLSRRALDGTLVIAAADLAGYDAGALAALWPALAARVGLALDRRGTSRAAMFTIRARSGGTVQLAGGFELVRRRDASVDGFVLRRTAGRATVADSAFAAALEERPLVPSVTMGGWRFRLAGQHEAEDGGEGAPPETWRARLPADLPLTVRAWQPGDRMRAEGRSAARRVKRFFADARVPGMDRAGWPVVLAAGEIVWIPGVRRSDAATDRSGRPGVRYVCERISS